MKRAYSYIRFSTAEQLKGKSLERQTDAATGWCRQHNVELDTELTLHDLGVSAFRGKNADVGALGSFLKAVHAGQVAQGSYLLIETFDRMSRESAYDAQLTLQNIISAGITVVTLMDGNQYNVALLRENPFRILEALLIMIRSHEESKTKSKRICDAWSRKRADLKNGKRLSKVSPGWITVDDRGKPKLIPERAKIVRRIFTLFLDGMGRQQLGSKLSLEGVPTFRGGRWWGCTYIDSILRNRAVIGEFQAYRMDHSDPNHITKRVPDGEPIKNYWPPVIDVRTFNAAQKRLATLGGKRSTRTRGIKNILAGVGRCALCDSLMERYAHEHPRLICARARAGAGCSYKSLTMSMIETFLAENAEKLAADVPDTTAELRDEIAAAEAQRDKLRTRIADMALVLSDLPSRTVASRIQEDEAAIERLDGEIARLKTQLQFGSAARIREAVSRMKTALQWYPSDPGHAAEVNIALRECFEKIVFDLAHKKLVMHWRHGQSTTLGY